MRVKVAYQQVINIIKNNMTPETIHILLSVAIALSVALTLLRTSK